MIHVTTINCVLTYELQPQTDDDRHVIELMKNKTEVSMKMGKNGGIIFELSRPAAKLNAPAEFSQVEPMKKRIVGVGDLPKPLAPGGQD